MNAHEFFYGTVPGAVSLADAVWASRSWGLTLKVLFTPSDRVDLSIASDGDGRAPGENRKRDVKARHLRLRSGKDLI